MPSNARALLQIARQPEIFTRLLTNIQLRPYQLAPIRPILDSIFHHRGDSFVIIFSRQSGKDELLANLIVYLLARLHAQEASIVCAQPTFQPQTITAMNRLDARLARPWFKKLVTRTGGRFYRLGQARCTYLSAEPTANVVGVTARTLLIINEAQDVDPRVYDKSFAPMAASGNATKIFSGTRWTSDTLLSRELRLALAAEQVDGRKRAFIVTGEEVGQSNPYYAQHLADQVARFGRNHPLIRSQYFCEEIDAQAGMFPPGRQALMKGDHPARTEPEPGQTYAFLIDVAGQDEFLLRRCRGGSMHPDPHWHPPLITRPSPALSPAQIIEPSPLNSNRDSTALKIVEVDMSTVKLQGKPTYKVVFRRLWTGEKHVNVFGALQSLGQLWKPARIVIDATGVGEGLWSLLDNAFGADTVLPVKFTPQIKSQLGYGLLGIIESGRYREYHPFDETLRLQLDKCRSEILPGPAKLMRWGVPDGTQDPATGRSVHDDDLTTAALCTILDGLKWTYHFKPFIIPGRDPLKDMDRNY